MGLGLVCLKTLFIICFKESYNSILRSCTGQAYCDCLGFWFFFLSTIPSQSQEKPWTPLLSSAARRNMWKGNKVSKDALFRTLTKKNYFVSTCENWKENKLKMKKTLIFYNNWGQRELELVSDSKRTHFRTREVSSEDEHCSRTL